MDIKQNGVEVGRYNPKFHEIDKRVTTQTFAGPYNFLTDEERKNKKQGFDDRELADRKEGKPQLSPNQKKKKMEAQMRQLHPPQRDNPFKPGQSFYHERKTL